MKLTPAEAYERLKAIVAHVNMIVSAFSSEAFISNADAVLASEDARAAADAAQCGSDPLDAGISASQRSWLL